MLTSSTAASINELCGRIVDRLSTTTPNHVGVAKNKTTEKPNSFWLFCSFHKLHTQTLRLF